MFKKVSNISKEECLKEIVLWSNIIGITWFICLFSFIGLTYLLIILNLYTYPQALIIQSLPLILIFGLIYPLDIVNDIMRKEGLINEPRRIKDYKG